MTRTPRITRNSVLQVLTQHSGNSFSSHQICELIGVKPDRRACLQVVAIAADLSRQGKIFVDVMNHRAKYRGIQVPSRWHQFCALFGFGPLAGERIIQ